MQDILIRLIKKELQEAQDKKMMITSPLESRTLSSPPTKLPLSKIYYTLGEVSLSNKNDEGAFLLCMNI